MKKTEIEAAIQAQQDVIRTSLAELKSTDYIGIKIAEGKATKTEYSIEIARRQQLRDTINQAEEEIARLEGLEPEEDAPAAE